MEIIPAILTDKQSELIELIERIKRSKKFTRVQIDFVDGKYAANKSITPLRMKLRWGQGLKFDAHLMVVEKNLQEYLKGLAKFDRIIVQMESVARPEDFDCLALDIHSPIESIKPYLPKLKLVNLMSIEPGFGGQELDLKILQKISHLSNLRDLRNLKLKICVDGGVEKQHLPMLQNLGVDEVAVGARRVLEWN
ncbi:MAG: Ribulose-phosphate 3-epimerase [Candidatus Amesbacteria bacterium GW2011_GWA2_47_70]|uniref:Ribulose-phosphate 3-epimerase n=1 Tax=Candidatus Amesbacteria bacterium GW2011_GWC2_45_19 TaxID=1618366 RepID=A0A0G1M3N6_9BACT|nr:MAG: Ribulose-phosphate 3-epimerase [Candidatus Amesbacteria bacterium GW2011_GWC2_45_19]KKU37249.1 MAG: Ribulose-phosphate 3-epimerase [Candidatus Amesbacteria bacterium GW2011_GWA1_46_35]KKU68237.1 MAG: Ribulose-phosphate 3-epimerase [Microgenomates group bacterium GW2011_GWC1_47_20]KKU78917.1 MAG: Ribulose-phosphate 3-epimerase [Candidatus Amesbacteria bacterium GW2011_GWA2_47_70]